MLPFILFISHWSIFIMELLTGCSNILEFIHFTEFFSLSLYRGLCCNSSGVINLFSIIATQQCEHVTLTFCGEEAFQTDGLYYPCNKEKKKDTLVFLVQATLGCVQRSCKSSLAGPNLNPKDMQTNTIFIIRLYFIYMFVCLLVCCLICLFVC